MEWEFVGWAVAGVLGVVAMLAVSRAIVCCVDA
jgi:hypothetical protein